MRFLIIGYYNQGNCGDEAYKLALPKIFPSDAQMHFVKVSDVTNYDVTNYDVLIFGAGDVFTPYFLDTVLPIVEKFKGPKVAISVGFSYLALMEKSSKFFDYIWTRNYDDVRRLQSLNGTYTSHYCPDACLLLEPERVSNSAPTGKCFFSLVPALLKMPQLLNAVINLVKHALRHYEIVVLLRFDNSEKLDNDDIGVINKVVDVLNVYKDRVIVDLDSTPLHIIDIINSCDYGVCMRYHAHIFSLICDKPFLSISTTRKTRKLMEDAELTDYQFVNSSSQDINYEELAALFINTKRSYNYSAARLYVRRARDLLFSGTIYFKIKNLLKCESGLLSEEFLNYSLEVLQTYGPVVTSKYLCEVVRGNCEDGMVYGLINKLSHNKLPTTMKLCIKELMTNTPLNPTLMEPIIIESLKFNFILSNYSHFASLHRHGWGEVVDLLSQYRSNTGIHFDLYVDSTFHWNLETKKLLGQVPYTIPWIGIIHHPVNTGESENNCVELFQKKEFLISLLMCHGLFVLSSSLAQYVRSRLRSLSIPIPVNLLYHPMKKRPEFKMCEWLNLKSKGVVQIGSWLRKPLSFYLLELDGFSKYHLKGKLMEGQFPDKQNKCDKYVKEKEEEKEEESVVGAPCRDTHNTWELEFLNYCISNGYDIEQEEILREKLIQSVTVIPYLNNSDYDVLLSENIVFLNLIDASAVNTILECFRSATPIIVNNLPAVVEILGPDYPLLYDECILSGGGRSLSEWITVGRVMEAHQYLIERCKDQRFSNEYFMKCLRRSSTYDSC